MTDNALYLGDPLDVLRRHVPDESVDLVYVSPPAARALATPLPGAGVELVGPVDETMQALRQILGESSALADLTILAPRLVEIRRVLKGSGSVYVHCDPTTSHYIRLLLDAVFGRESFRNEIVWKRPAASGSAKRYRPAHDTILFYGRSRETRWRGGRQAYDETYIKERFYRGDARRWKDADLTEAGVRHGDAGASWRGFDVTAKGRHWQYPTAELDRLDMFGMVYWPSKPGGWPRLRRYLDEARGVPLQDIWVDISTASTRSAESLGYPIGRPEALLERMIRASSDEGDVVLDLSDEVGPAIVVAQKLNRRWIGIDSTQRSLALMKRRLSDSFGESVSYRVAGEPATAMDAEELAASAPDEFRWWALGIVGARPLEPASDADRGIDGAVSFRDEGESGRAKRAAIAVAAGEPVTTRVRELRDALDHGRAEIGVLICPREPTSGVRNEAASAGRYRSPGSSADLPRLQVLTVADLLAGRSIATPPVSSQSQATNRTPKTQPTDGMLPLL